MTDQLVSPGPLPGLSDVIFPAGTDIRADREGFHITLPDGAVLLMRIVEPGE